MATSGYLILGNNKYTVGSCEITYDCNPAATSSCNSWVNYDYGTGTASPRIKVKAYRADPWSTGNVYRVASTATTACTIQLNNWGWSDNDCSVEYEYEWYGVAAKPMSAEEKKAYEEKRLKERFSQIIQGRCAPNIAIRQNTKRQPLPLPADIREQRARETLRRVIGDQKYVNFIKHGFISVKGRSGLVYQIFTGQGITHVFDQGNLVERLCVVLQGSFPPTDSLIMRYLLILNNEQQFRSLAIKHSISGYERSRQVNGPAEIKPLAELFKELKSKVA